MSNRGKSNQENSKEIGSNGSLDCFRDSVVRRIPYVGRKENEKELD